MTRHQKQHAVVLGASMGGLLAARALAEEFERVTVVERDRLPEHSENRKGVPQGRHTHGLLARGAEILEAYFPGLTSALIAEGVPTADNGLKIRMIHGGRRSQPCETGRLALCVSRPRLEAHVRRRVQQLPQVELLERHDALGLVMDSRRERVTGIVVASRDGDKVERTLDADLVVDATGRGSKTPAWLAELGFPAPEEESVRINVSYVTRIFRRRPTDLGGDYGVIIAAEPPNRRLAVALAQEDDRWTVTLVGYHGERVPTELDAFVEYSRHVPSPDVYELLRDVGEPLGEPTVASYPASVRRRYERLRRFPERLVVTADAICSFNPTFGQGMSVAAVEATLLQATVAEGLERVGLRFFARAAQPIDAPWGIVVGNDLRFAETQGPRTLGVRLINAYMARYTRAAADDPVLSRALLEVGNLMAAPPSLMRPALLRRVLFRRTAAVAEPQAAVRLA